MLSRQRRLRASEVEEVLSRGISVRGGCLSAKFLRTSGPLRLAVIVPKSLARKATLRNRLRRAAYDAISADVFAARTGHAIFFVRAVPHEPLHTAFREDATALLKKILLIN